MAATSRHHGSSSFECFSLIRETYLRMFKKTPGSTLKELTKILEVFVYNENHSRNKYRHNNVELNVNVMHLSEDIVHSSMVMCFGSDCLAEVSPEEIDKCRRCVAQISDNIGYISFFNEKIADRCLQVLQDMKKLGQAVSIILSRFKVFM